MKMKKTLLYIAVLALSSVAMTSCDDDFERPPMVTPQATMKANTTIGELKTKFYTTEFNYATEIPAREDGSHYIISGRVTTSDESGNFFKQIVIEDETSAIQVNVDAYDLYQSYQFGQEVVIDVTGLYIGGYGKLMQIGAAPTSGYPSRIAEDVMTEHAQVNGLSDPGKIVAQEVTMAELANIQQNNEEWLAWQCRTVQIKDVTFADAGKKTLADANANTSRTISDGTGSIILYTSGYSDFYDYYCPEGSGIIVGILSFYNNSWQIRINSIDDLLHYELQKAPGTTPDTPDQPGTITGTGAKDAPFTVADVNAGATGTDAWVKGYIVGWVEGQVLSEGAKFNADATVASNLLIADSPDANAVAQCIPVQLPVGDVRSALNLQDNPGNLKKQVLLKGSLENYFGTKGLKSVSEFEIDGKPGGGDDPAPSGPVTSLNADFEGSTALPAGWTQTQIEGNKKWYVTTFQENNYVAMTGYKGTAPFDQWLLSPALDMANIASKILTFRTQVNGYGSKTSVLEVYVLDSPDVKTANKTKLDVKLATAPDSGYSSWAQSGDIDLSAFSGNVYIAFRYYATTDANYATWCVDDIKLNAN